MSKRKPGRERDSGGRERLLAAAVRLFAMKGYAATTVRDILRAADVTAPVLYYHFGSKEGLFVGLLRDGIEKLDLAVQKAVSEAGNATDRVRGFCVAHAAVRRTYADLTWLVDAMIGGPPEAAPQFDFKATFARTVRELAELVSAAVAAGEFRACDPVVAALALLGVVDMAVRSRLIGASVLGADDRLDAMLTVVLGGLIAPAPAQRSSL